MRTIVQLGNSNCGWCLSAMVKRLRAKSFVHRVQVDQTTGCLVVDHDCDDPSMIISEISALVHGWELASNGERVMVELDVHEELKCPWRGTDLDAEPGSPSEQVRPTKYRPWI